MTNLAVLLRAGQMFAHLAHNSVGGPSFFGDHGFFGSTYEAYEEAYDKFIEQEIGRGNTPDIPQIGIDAAKLVKELYDEEDADGLFRTQAIIEKRLRDGISEEMNDADDAAQSFLQGLAEASLTRSYMISKRLGE